jgi:hypothetical protein
MKQQGNRSWKRYLTSLLTGGCLLLATASVAAEIGSVLWQQKYNPTSSSWNNGFFYAVGFNTDGSILANGNRGEADSATAIGVRYHADTGAVLDVVPEWFLFEYNFYDYAQDNFADQHIDSNGNVFFVGQSYAAAWNSFSARYNIPNIWKYSSSYNNPDPGNPERPLWRSYYVGSGAAADNNGRFEAMATDSNGNIYAVGFYLKLSSSVSQRDWIIDKFDSDGSRVEGFPLSHNKDNLHDYSYDVAVDSEDNFVVAGSVLVDAATDHHDWVVRKYSSEGALLWAIQHDLAGSHDQALGVAVDGDDNVIVVGYHRNALPAGDNDWYIVKYAKDGDGEGGAKVIWEKSWDNGNSQHGLAYDLVLDNRDFIYLVGSQQKNSTDPAYSNRYRPFLQYRSGLTGELLDLQEIIPDPTVNNRRDLEHDYFRAIAMRGNRLVISGYTQQDGDYRVVRGRTGRVIMLDLLPIFANGFE